MIKISIINYLVLCEHNMIINTTRNQTTEKLSNFVVAEILFLQRKSTRFCAFLV